MLLGLDEKINLFKKLAANGGLSHAYLFYGQPEVGKFTFAKSFAYFLEYGEFIISEKPLIDYQEVLPDPEKGSIGIDAIRQIKNFLYQKPFKSEKRLTIIDQAQTLTAEAQGALLKILEEPPASALVIVISYELSVLLPPLLSRLAKIYFSPLPAKELEKVLGVSPKIAALSFGRVGRALKLMEINRNMIEIGDSEESLEKSISRKILGLYLNNKMKNAGLIRWLLQKEEQANRFNLNSVLQRKAVELKTDVR